MLVEGPKRVTSHKPGDDDSRIVEGMPPGASPPSRVAAKHQRGVGRERAPGRDQVADSLARLKSSYIKNVVAPPNTLRQIGIAPAPGDKGLFHAIGDDRDS